MMSHVQDLPSAVQLASESPERKVVLMFEAAKGKALQNLPGQVQLVSETEEQKSVIAVFAAAK